MTRPLTPDEAQLLDQLARTGLTLGQLCAHHPTQARTIRNTAARARHALTALGILLAGSRSQISPDLACENLPDQSLRYAKLGRQGALRSWLLLVLPANRPNLFGSQL